MLGLVPGFVFLSFSDFDHAGYRPAGSGNHGKQTARRPGGRWLGAIGFSNSVRDLLGTESVCANAAGMPLFALPYERVCLHDTITGCECTKLVCRMF